MATSAPARFGAGRLVARLEPAQVIVVGSLTFSLVATWRAAVIVLSDLSSTPYYIRVVETAIGPIAPFLVLGTTLVGHALHWGSIESSMLPVGRVARVVHGTLGGLLTRMAVFVLVVDYLCTGPARIASVGRWVANLLARISSRLDLTEGDGRMLLLGGVTVAAITATFDLGRRNSPGARESGRRTRVRAAATIAAMIVWCSVAPGIRDELANRMRRDPPLQPIARYATSISAAGGEEESMGFTGHALADLARKLRHSRNWLSLAGVVGLVLAFLRCAACPSMASAGRICLAGHGTGSREFCPSSVPLRSGKIRFAGPPG